MPNFNEFTTQADEDAHYAALRAAGGKRPLSLRPRRAKLFTDGKQRPIDRNARAGLILLAEAARRNGRITRAAVDVLRALAYTFANLKDGRCIPSYDRIAEAAGCCARTVGRCIEALEAAGLISWVNRIMRIRERVPGLPGVWASTWRVIRTSNAYDFPTVARQASPSSTNRQKDLGTTILDTYSSTKKPQEPLLPELQEIFDRWGSHVTAAAR